MSSFTACMRMSLLLNKLIVIQTDEIAFQCCFVLTFKRMSPDTTLAGMMANATRATFFQPGHKQVSVLFPAVSPDLL